MTKYILAIDAGTTGVQAALFTVPDLVMHGSNKVDFPQIYQQPGWVEHDPEDIWHATLQAIKNTLAKVQAEEAAFALTDIVGIGITNQRETCVPWHKKTGECAGNALVWQDRRTADLCDALKKDTGIRNMLLQKTGLVCDPYFSASKMAWMLSNYPKAHQWNASGDLAFGTIDCYIIWKLTAGVAFVTEHTNASRTMLYNLHTGTYDAELLQLFKISPESLPEIKDSTGLFGVTKELKLLPDGIPIAGTLGDQQAALFGQDCINSGEAKITFGTGAFLLMNIGNKVSLSDDGLLTTVAYSANGQRTFALEGSAFIAGAAVQFLRDNFLWMKNSAESAALALSAPRDAEVMFVPALAGLGAPYWNPNARGVLFGLTRGTQRAQIVRAVLESIALQNVQLLQIMMQMSNEAITRVAVDGGAAQNDFLVQFQADILQTTLCRPQNTETTSLGAAKAALLGLKITPSSTEKTWQEFSPQVSGDVAQKILAQWLNAVACVHAFYKNTPTI